MYIDRLHEYRETLLKRIERFESENAEHILSFLRKELASVEQDIALEQDSFKEYEQLGFV